MVPRPLLRQLNLLRRRERLLRLTWAAARCLAVIALALVAACLVDFVVDLYRDTPRWLRAGLLAVQAALWLAGSFVVLRALARRLSDTELALWVEEKTPGLGHRLISAVQLNRPGADTAGMSPEMIAAVTRQAEQAAAAANFARVADARRLKWAAELLAPPALVAALVFLCWPDTVRALLARQFLEDVPIPRSLSIESAAARQVWPAGEEGVLRFRVRGAFAEHLRGEVRLDPADGPPERHELVFDSEDADGNATFIARVPPSSHDFTYHARLKDGRTHEPAEVHFEPRPVVRHQQAWVQLPASVGKKPDGRPYEEPQKGADIVYRLAGSAARIAVETQKPIVRATVELLGPSHAFAEAAAPGTRAEAVRRSVDLVVADDGMTAEGTFSFQPGIRPDSLATLAAGGGVGCPVCLPWAGLVLAARGDPVQTETAYRIVVRDEFGLENNDRPRRGIRTGPVEAPEVALLPETLARDARDMSDEDEIEGIPILLGQRVPLAYECKAVYGLHHARLRYRVLPHTASREDDEPRDADFLPLPLGAPSGQAGSSKAREEFWLKPSDDPERPDGTEGGGRYDFDSSGIPDGKGGLLRLQEGDRIQFFVEVFGRADPDGTPGRSAVREKEVVNQKDFWAWVEKKEDHKERIRQLEERQRGVAGSVSMLPPERPHVVPERPTPRDLTPAQPEGEHTLGRSWLLLGPFPNEKDAGHDRAYAPEAGDVEPVDLSTAFDGLKGKVRWQAHQSTTDKIDLQKFFDHGEAGVGYAVCWIKHGWKANAILATGSDDGIKVWLGRKLVLDKAVHREAVPAEDKTPVMLDGGWQELLVKVDNRFGTWAFYLDLLDPGTGKPIRGPRLQVRLAPPGGGRRFVRDWLVVGPFAAPANQAHDKAFGPERDAVDPKREFDGWRGKVRWKEYHSPEDKIDLLRACSVDEATGAAAYAAVWVHTDARRLVVLGTGSDDGIKVWVNRRVVLDKKATRAAEPDSDRMTLPLSAGWNEVLVKIDNTTGPWCFFLSLREPTTNESPSGLEYRLAPPEKKKK